jgi:hypothetical protein
MSFSTSTSLFSSIKLWNKQQALKTFGTIVTCKHVFFKSFLKIALVVNKTFLYHDHFNENGEGLIELLKGENSIKPCQNLHPCVPLTFTTWLQLSSIALRTWALLIASSHWKLLVLLTTFKTIICTKGVSFQDIGEGRWMWNRFSQVNTTLGWFGKFLDDVWSCQICSRLNDYGLPCVYDLVNCKVMTIVIFDM